LREGGGGGSLVLRFSGGCEMGLIDSARGRGPKHNDMNGEANHPEGRTGHPKKPKTRNAPVGGSERRQKKFSP